MECACYWAVGRMERPVCRRWSTDGVSMLRLASTRNLIPNSGWPVQTVCWVGRIEVERAKSLTPAVIGHTKVVAGVPNEPPPGDCKVSSISVPKRLKQPRENVGMAHNLVRSCLPIRFGGQDCPAYKRQQVFSFARTQSEIGSFGPVYA